MVINVLINIKPFSALADPQGDRIRTRNSQLSIDKH